MMNILRNRMGLAALILVALVGQAYAQAGGDGKAVPDSTDHAPTGLDSLMQRLPPGEFPMIPDSLQNGAMPDSLERGADEDGEESGLPDIPGGSLGVHPKFRHDTRSTDRRMDISNSLDFSVSYPTTWNLSGQIFYDRGLPRELKRETTEKGLSISSSKRLSRRFPLSLNARRNRKLQEQNIGEENYRRDEWDSSSLSAQTSGGWDITDWLGVNGNVNASANQSNTENNKGLRKATADGARDFAARLDLNPAAALSFTTGYS
nr:hypothetical protein [bacterium]